MYGILTDLVIAQRNVLRQRRRSAFALAAISLGVAAIILAGGFIEWNFLHYRETMIKTQLGHLRIHRAGYSESGASDPFGHLLPEEAPELTMLTSQQSVRTLAPRLNLSGLASHGDATLPFIAEGVDPAAETELSQAVTMLAGEQLSSNDPTGIIMGQGLATNLGVRPGDRVVLVVNTASGAINATDAHVRGVFATVSKSYDDLALRLPIASARKLLRVHGSHTWVVLLDDTDHTEPTLTRLTQLLGAGYEVVPWWKLSDFYNKSADLFSRQANVMKGIIALLIVLSISNTLMMSVMERTGEIGTSMALGVRRSGILRHFVVEGIVLGVIGSALGVCAGWVLAEVISSIGIPVPPPPGMGHGYTGRILVTAGLIGGAMTLAISTTFLASLYPAWRASRLEVVDALRRNR